MPGLKLITSNRLEILAEKLVEKTNAKPLSSPLTQEVIIVQSRGMERWLSMEYARKQGICANFRFPFPNSFIQEIFRRFIPDLPEHSAFDPEILTWKIMRFLLGPIDSSEFSSISEYLKDDKSGLKQYQLARRIADTFDHYTVFRPDMILKWDENKSHDWQAKLWQKLSKGNKLHRAAIKENLLKATFNQSFTIHDFPERISIFGISALPPFHLEILVALSSLVEVNLFLMNPCREFWADIVSDRETDRIARRYDHNIPSIDDLHLEPGNSLLASTGVMGRDFFWLIHQNSCEEDEAFAQPEENNLLDCIQSDILNLRERGSQDIGLKSLSDNDRSIQIHSCHSPMREIEVLYENLLSIFEADPELNPRDILVMTPNIEAYAPYIQAIFNTRTDQSQRIPFNITDRNVSRESRIIRTFLAVLDLCDGRFEASKIAAILEPSFVHRKFSLSVNDVELIVHWLRQTRTSWGIDKHHRGRMGLPEYNENTWQAGLDRMLLGYALPGWNENLFKGILPFDSIEGDKAQALGKFTELLTRLFDFVKALKKPRRLSGWIELLADIYEKLFIDDEETNRELLIIRRALNKLSVIRQEAGFEKEVSLDVIIQYLKNEFDNESSGFGFIAGAVTFCAMLPMRSIPFKVICLIGMNHDSYPRQSKHLSFDLIAQQPRRGDRSIRNSDRYLFLEAILSARERFYISYVGQSIEDNSAIPPSVLVSELMDYINQGFQFPGANIQDHIVIRHRLQAFSPEYFKGDTKLFSYSRENFLAGQSMLERRKQPTAFISSGLPQTDKEINVIDIDELCRFFGNPSKYFLAEQLGIYLDEIDLTIEDREPYTMTGLEKYDLENRLLKKHLDGIDIKQHMDITRASGLLPHGRLGESIYRNIIGDIETFGRKLDEFRQNGPLESLAINHEVGGIKITGNLDNIYPAGRLQYRVATVKARDRLKIWIKHLLYNIIKPASYPSASIIIGSDLCLEYSSPENSLEVLRQFLDLYRQGRWIPLRFFPKSSLKFAESIYQNKPEDYALNKANSTWSGTDHNRGESEDSSYKLCFGNTSPGDDVFKDIALKVYLPLLEKETRRV
ncbi:MAG: exodeoxyribonuclease V subunit gamma [candidate division Zixibacteria bacterium]|nr:exodeoxyribonuclease V subunit gamma [candidate division Zixibacteria bacterium]